LEADRNGHDAPSAVDPGDHSDLSVPVLWQVQVSHYVEKVRWALDYKRVPHVRRSLLPGLHAVKAKRLTGDTSTAPVLTLDARSIRDSTRIIAEIEERWLRPPLYPEDPAQRRRALQLEEFFDEELGPHIRRAFYHELLPQPNLVLRGPPDHVSALSRPGTRPGVRPVIHGHQREGGRTRSPLRPTISSTRGLCSSTCPSVTG
jgi:glutathione S-transferase